MSQISTAEIAFKEPCELVFLRLDVKHIFLPWLLRASGVKLTASKQGNVSRCAFKKKNAGNHASWKLCYILVLGHSWSDDWSGWIGLGWFGLGWLAALVGWLAGWFA